MMGERKNFVYFWSIVLFDQKPTCTNTFQIDISYLLEPLGWWHFPLVPLTPLSMGIVSSFFKTLFDTDPDDLFAYTTPKLVTIRDRKLGILHYTFQLLIFLYIVIVILAGAGKNNVSALYATTPPLTLSSLNVKNPAEFSGAPVDPFPTYCPDLDYGKLGSPTPIPRRFRGSEASTPFPSSLLVHTRSEISEEYRPCNDFLTNSSCNFPIPAGPSYQFYVGNVWDFTLRIQFSVSSPINADLYSSSLATSGYVVDQNGDPFCKFKANSDDIMYMSDVLKASGVFKKREDLDTYPSYLSSNAKSQNCVRYDGALILLLIDVTNVHAPIDPDVRLCSDFGGNQVTLTDQSLKDLSQPEPSPYPFSYRYRFINLPGEFKYEIYQWLNFPNTSRRINHHGIFITSIASGAVGQPSVANLLLQLTVSIGLLKLASTLVDQVMLRVLSDKEIYKHLKYFRSADFSDLTPEQKAAFIEASTSMELGTQSAYIPPHVKKTTAIDPSVGIDSPLLDKYEMQET